MLKISQRDHRDLQGKAKSDLKHIREALKKEPVVKAMFKKYKRDINQIDNVCIRFDPNLDVSAKTVNGKIFLNAKMLEENWKNYMHYAVHEIQHFLQHTSDNCDEYQDPNAEYLDNPSEIEAFQAQLKFREKTEPKSVVNDYLKDLFDKHDLPKKERPAKKKELLDS